MQRDDTTIINHSMDVAPMTTPVDHQLQSPLFGVIPAEIRNAIFALALVQFEDDDNAYPQDSFWCRPGFAGPQKSSSSLLRTCKLAHMEGQQVFLKKLEWAFWLDRGPPGWSRESSLRRFFQGLTLQQSKDLESVRLFTQMYWLEGEGNLRRLFRTPMFRPTSITITIRYSDWWWWEDDHPLRMSENWLASFCGPTSIRELKVEYETTRRKRSEMMKIVERNKKWKLEIDGEQGHLSAEHTKLTEWSWNGPSKFEGQAYTHHGGDETMEYTVVTDTWRYCKTPMKDEDMAKRQSYYSIDDSSDDGQEGFGDADDDEGDTGFDEEDEFEDDDDGADAEENTEENTDGDDENTEPGGQR